MCLFCQHFINKGMLHNSGHKPLTFEFMCLESVVYSSKKALLLICLSKTLKLDIVDGPKKDVLVKFMLYLVQSINMRKQLQQSDICDAITFEASIH